ncbi:maltose operon protein [Marinobacterium nitratireducens]|uniref:Maltose operon protein n=1 Tax=Marinobacterium nitratireducens TaxID=518897 RepID=A0A917ZNG1_9GAMM|nr:MalM family protein [Marinobacterium nitratireducens]GGO87387.1 maltose operon protein [Marinobacterium nitratireducens]
MKTLVSLPLLCIGLWLATPVQAQPSVPSSAPASCCQTLSTLPFRDLPVGAKLSISISDDTPRFRFDEGDSRFVAFRLPDAGRSFEVTLTSLVAEEVFQPRVLLLDSAMRPTRVFDADAFPYRPARGFAPDALQGRLRIDGERYLIVYTTPYQRSGATRLEHPAKTFARAHGNEPPSIPDPVVPHGDTGLIEIRLDAQGGFAPGQRLLQPLLAVAGTAGAEAAQGTVAPPEAAQEDALPETERYFRGAIDAALSSGDLDRALRLAEEARKAGAEGARSHLLERLQSGLEG